MATTRETVGRRAALAVLLAALVVSRGAQAAGYSQYVQVGIGLADGTSELFADSFGAPFTIDPSHLRILVRPFAKPDATLTPLSVTVGAAQFVPEAPSPGSGGRVPAANRVMTRFVIPATFSDSPGAPGIYAAMIQATDGFARTVDGTELPLAPTGLRTSELTALSWPHTSHGDAELTRLRNRLVGRDVYGYGGISISCPPDWTKFYGPSTPVRVRDVERMQGAYTLATGSDASAPVYMGLSFIAFDPVRIIVDAPTVQPIGENWGVRGTKQDCPELTLADWQVDVTLTAHPPSDSIRAKTDPVQLGMTRDAVVWSRGYPNELGGRTTLWNQSTWFYGRGNADSYTVTFRQGRVVSFTQPQGMP